MYKLKFTKEINTKYNSSLFLVKENTQDQGNVFRLEGWAWDFDEGSPPFDKLLEVTGVIFTPEGVRSVKKLDLSKFIIDLTIPSPGFYNTKYSVIYMRRNPYRQWKRSLSPNNSNLILLNSGIDSIDMELGLINIYLSILNGRLLPVEKAIKSIIEGERLFSAFSADYCVGVHTTLRNSVVVYYKDIPIGIIDKSPSGFITKIPSKASHFIEDLEQFLPVECIK